MCDVVRIRSVPGTGKELSGIPWAGSCVKSATGESFAYYRMRVKKEKGGAETACCMLFPVLLNAERRGVFMSGTVGKREIRVFVTDGLWRKTLAAVRGLGRVGVKVTVGESTLLAPALFSKYSDTIVCTPSPILDPSRYIEFITDYLFHHYHDVLIPMEEDTQILIAKHRTILSKLTNLFLGDYESLLLIQDKLNVTRQADSLGIPTPKTYDVLDLESGLSLLDRLSYPVVVKPRVGSGSAGVQYIETREQWIPALRKAFQAGSAPLVQERLPREGSGVGACFLMDGNQKVLASFVHKRLREYPVGVGPARCGKASSMNGSGNTGSGSWGALGFKGSRWSNSRSIHGTGSPGCSK